jgi:tRNA U34 5-carboxymethylaminomethyl modifying GTPase MnmE/TrmE
MSDSDLVLVVIDGTDELGPSDRDLLDQTISTRRLVVMNKSDLPAFKRFEKLCRRASTD